MLLTNLPGCKPAAALSVLSARAAVVCAQIVIVCVAEAVARHRVAACNPRRVAAYGRASAGVLDGATHVYMANLCFPEALNHAMTAALAAVSLRRARPRAGYLPDTCLQ